MPRISPVSAEWLARAGVFLAILCVVIWTWIARMPGWNPDSLWYDDLVWGAITLAPLSTIVTIPAHAEPGFFVALWGARTLFGDPEWSLQVLPFLCGLVAIPVMALVVRRVTHDNGLALLAAALTALNPLLAHYSLFVKQYSLGFVITALILLGAVRLFETPRVNPRWFAAFSIAAGLAIFFSVPSVLASFPVVNLAAIRTLWPTTRDPDRTRVLSIAAGYDLLVLAAYFLLQDRGNDLVQEAFRRGFIRTNSLTSIWRTTVRQGQHLLEASLPSWTETNPWDPATVSWTLPVVGLGLVWLLARRSTRTFGLVIAGFFGAFFVASALRIYPLGVGRTDIFAFPVGICLFAVGMYAATALLPRAVWVRGVLGIAVAGFALYQPVRPTYWAVDDARLVHHLAAGIAPGDGLILSPAGAYLASFYGEWPVVISATSHRTNATQADIVRDTTLHLHPGTSTEARIDQFLAEYRPARIWYVAYRARSSEVLERLSDHGYQFNEVERSVRGRLFMLVDGTQR